MRWSISASVRLLVMGAIMCALACCAVPAPGPVDEDPVDPETPMAADAVGTLQPAADAAGVNVDTLLRISFDEAPTLGTSGLITIHRASDNAVVDTIDLADAPVTNPTTFQALTAATMNTTVNIIGNTPGSGASYPDQVRIVNYRPLKVEGATVKIVPHNNKLAYNTQYYVLIEDGALSGFVDGAAFAGIKNPLTWRFTTKTAPTVSGAAISVNADGSGDFSTVQGALDYIPAGNTTPYTVSIADGVYEELLFTRNKSNVSLTGASRGATIIEYDNFDSFNNGTGGGTAADAVLGLSSSTPFARGGRSVFLVSGGTGVQMATLTLRSTHAQGSAPANQAETLYFNSASGTLIARQCDFIGYQDTLQLKGFCWIFNCLVAGDVDFIWGAAKTALFEGCEIRSRYNSNGGYLVQARAEAGYGGYIFLNCVLTREASVVNQTVYLARSYTTSGSGAAYNDNVAFIGCAMDAHIRPVGFLLPATVVATNPGVSTPVAGWREYKSNDMTGGALDVSTRGATNGTTAVAGSSYSASPAALGCLQLSDSNATAFYANRATIFAATTTDGMYTMSGVTGGWNPQP